MATWNGLFNNKKENKTLKENFAALKYLRPMFALIWQTNKTLTFLNINLRFLKAVIPSALLLVGKFIIDEIIKNQQTENIFSNYLWILISIEFALALLSDGLNRLINLTDGLLGDLFANKTSISLIEHAAQMDLAQFEDSKFYDKLEMARRQTTNRVVLMSQVLSQAQDTITIGFLLAGLIYLQPLLILLLFISVIPSFLNETYFSQKNYSLARSWTPERRELDYLRFIGASNETAKEIKIFGLENFIKKRFENVAKRYFEANKKLALKRTFWGISLNVFGEIAYYFAYIFLIKKTIIGALTIGSLVFLSGSFARLSTIMQSILIRFSQISESAMYIKDYFDFLAIKPNIHNTAKPIPFPKILSEGFEFKNVGFQYPGSEKWAIRNLSFQFIPGEKLALVGENGAGKTTLVKLVSRLYDPSEGEVLLEGINLKLYDLHDLRRNIGVIFQDYVKFQFLASENIAIGDIDKLEEIETIKQSAIASLADPIIKNLPLQYNQMLGNRFSNGIDLSGGEWQKVALARAYMRNSTVLVLDEPTAALDARAEFEAFQRFAKLTQGKMAILISHRFSTVRMADRILVLKNGKLSEIGTHEELLLNNGLYAELFNLQAKGYQ